MNKVFDRFVNFLETWGVKVAQITYLSCIKDAFTDLLPLIITGSFATLFNNVICSTKNGLAQFNGFGFLADLGPIFSAVNYATMNLLGLYLVYLVGAQLASIRNSHKQFSGLLALVCYIVLVPTTATATASTSQETVNLANVIASKYTNSQGMFLAIIVGILSVELFVKLQKIEKIQIRMPESVPTGVSKSFQVLIPAMITTTIFGIIGYVFVKLAGQNIPDFIYSTLQTPMEAIMQYPAGVIVLALICQCFWIIGIHGNQVIGVVRNSIGLAAAAANLAAFEAGQPLPNIFTYTFWNTYVTIGGGGNTLALILAIILFSKREDHRAIAKISAIPGFFGVNEPMIFGMPIVLNPYLCIPFIFAPVISAAVGYAATAVGFAGAAMITLPFNIPPIINAYVSTNGSIGTVITQMLCFAISFLIYIPFVKLCNKQAETVE